MHMTKNDYTPSEKDSYPELSLNIITRQEHNISRKQISDNALKVLYRLHGAGFDAFLVGGGVRDLLLAQNPKDFDIATNASALDALPQDITQLQANFSNNQRRHLANEVAALLQSGRLNDTTTMLTALFSNRSSQWQWLLMHRQRLTNHSRFLNDLTRRLVTLLQSTLVDLNQRRIDTKRASHNNGGAFDGRRLHKTPVNFLRQHH